MSIVKDQIGREIKLNNVPKRIISLVPSLTELLCDLALENELIGITKYCVHPFHLKSTKVIVGGTKKVKIKVIEDLQPDFILCNKEENSKELVDELEKIAPTFVTDINTILDTQNLITTLGNILNRRTESTNLNSKINYKLAHFKEFIQHQPNRKVAYFIWANPWMVAGKGTYIDSILKLNNFTNIYANLDRYPQIDIKRIRFEGDPDVVILSSEPFNFSDEHAMELATYTNRSVTVFGNGEYFSWYGSRILKAFDYFKELHAHLNSHF